MESAVDQAFTASEGDHRSRVAQARRTRTRARILAAAVRVFTTKGRYGLVIDDFIQAAGVSRGTFYNYFPSVDALFEEASRWLEDDLMVSIETALTPLADPVDRLSTGVRLWLKKAEADREWCAFVAQNDRRGENVEQSVLRDLADGRDAGAFRFASLDAARDLLVGTLREAMVRLSRGGATPKHSDDVARTVLAGLGLEPRAIEGQMNRALPPMRRPARTIT